MSEYKTINENPSISDKIIFDIDCPDIDGCFIDDPYKIDNIKIYYIERNHSGTNYKSYSKNIYDDKTYSDLNAAIKAACDSPTEENLSIVNKLQIQLDYSKKIETFYYNDAKAVAVFGSEDYPAWLSTDTTEAFVYHAVDENNNPINGKFKLEWTPLGMREGDYFICWTWTPNIAGDSISNNIQFFLAGNTQLTTSIPTHFTKQNKYSTLLENYLPEMFKLHISNTDLTPEVLRAFNEAIAKGFTGLEDLANQIPDLTDSNSTHESFLFLLGNLFDIKLQTNDPTLWRRQIKRAIPLYKKKGTYSGLEEALKQAGAILKKFTKLWQVVSNYTYQEVFVASNSTTFTLSKRAILPIDSNNFELYYKENGNDEWTVLTQDYVELSQSGSDTTLMDWVGNNLSISPIELFSGDSIRIVYQIKEIPDVNAQDIETYIRTLSLADQRTETDQNYPLKNWNVRVLEEDDPMFDLIVPVRHPYYDPLIYGKIRTKFPYSENIYNMEEYNGSTRDSYDPCDIDKEFMDSCSSCLGSKFSVDLEIENLSTDRILEIQEVIKNFVPFHAVLHSINLSGSVVDLVKPSIERIGTLINMSGKEYTISGNGQTIFNRSMTNLQQIKRDELANVTTVVNDAAAIAYNEKIVIYSPNVFFNQLPLDKENTWTYLEVLSPSVNAGVYTVSNASKNYIEIFDGDPISEPINQSAFTFRLSNIRASKSNANITQDDVHKLTDANIDFYKLDIKTQWDIENTSYTGGAWTVTIPAYSSTYEIKNVLSDGTLILDDVGNTLPVLTTIDVNYTIKNDLAIVQSSSSTGRLKTERRGRVNLGSSFNVRGNTETLEDIRTFFDSYHDHGKNHYVLYDSNQYLFSGFVAGSISEFYISGYADGNVVGVPITILQRLCNSEKGYFHYSGLKLVTNTNQETGLNIRNGANSPAMFTTIDSSGENYILQLENDTFKENFLIVIGTDYYAISEIDGNIMWVIGTNRDWKISGTPITYDILKSAKLGADIAERTYPKTPAGSFDLIDRRGNDVIGYTEQLSSMMLSAAFNAANNNEQLDVSSQKENVGYTIKMRDGSQTEGEI